MNNKHKTMLQEAIASIDALSTDELEKDFREFGIDVVRKQKPMSDVEIAKLLNVSEEWFLKSDLTKLKNLVRLVEQHHGIGE